MKFNLIFSRSKVKEEEATTLTEEENLFFYLVLTMVSQPQQQQHIRGIPTTAFAGSASGMDANKQCLDEQLFLPSQQQLPLPLPLKLQQQQQY